MAKRIGKLISDSCKSATWRIIIKDGNQYLETDTGLSIDLPLTSKLIDELCHNHNCELTLGELPPLVLDFIAADFTVVGGVTGTFHTPMWICAPDTVGLVAEFHRAFEYEIPEEPCVPGIHTPFAKEFLRGVAEELHTITLKAKRFLAACPNQHMLPQCIQRVALQTEELRELFQAMADEDLVACLDACEDMLYVDSGTLVSLGLAPVHHEAFRRVHASNMSKLKDGKVVKDAQGKVVKGDWYTPVDLTDLVENLCET